MHTNRARDDTRVASAHRHRFIASAVERVLLNRRGTEDESPARVRLSLLVLLVLEILIRRPVHREVVRLLDRFAATILRLQWRFRVENPDVRPGDVLLVLSGSDIHFHGMIGMIEDGRGVATDRRGSLLPATVQ